MILSSFALKVIAIIFMVLDHVLTYVPGVNIPIWFGYLGKLAAPIFFYLIVEGFFHTRSRKKYAERLFSFAGVMIIVDILFKIHNNIFLSLGMGVLLMCGLEYAKGNKEDNNKRIGGILLAIISGVLMMFTEASYFGLGMILIFYFLREKKLLMSIVYVIFSLLPVFMAIGNGTEFLESIMLWDYQWMMVFSIFLINMYNGKLGLNNKFTKWLFYGFYPIHLILIVLIGRFVM